MNFCTAAAVPCGGCGGSGRPALAKIGVCNVCNGIGKLVLVAGLPVTMRLRRDLYPGTIESVSKDGREVSVRSCEVLKERFFVPGELVHAFTRRQDGSWRLKGRQTLLLSFGIRSIRRDQRS